MAVLRKLGNGRKVCFIGGSCFSPLWGLANYKILLVAMRGMHLWRVERPTSRSGDGKGARLPVNSRASLTSRREKNGEALGKTLGSLRMRGADVCNFFFFSPSPPSYVYRLHLRMDEISISLALCLSSSTRYAGERRN